MMIIGYVLDWWIERTLPDHTIHGNLCVDHKPMRVLNHIILNCKYCKDVAENNNEYLLVKITDQDYVRCYKEHYIGEEGWQ